VITLSLPARPIWVKLAQNEERLVVATLDGGVQVWNVRDVLAGNVSRITRFLSTPVFAAADVYQATPSHIFSSGLPSPIIDVLPNPAVSSEPAARLVGLLGREGIVFADIEERRLSAPVPGPFTCGTSRTRRCLLVVPEAM
jgi:nucleoporin NUP159